MSFLLLALMDASERDVPGTLERLMQPYHALNGPIKRSYLLPCDVLELAVRFNLPIWNHADIVARLPECYEWPIGVDDNGLFVERPCNPQGRWTEWIIGGAWDGYLVGDSYNVNHADLEGSWERNCVLANGVLKAEQYRCVHDVLTPAGNWYSADAIQSAFQKSFHPCPPCCTVKRWDEAWWRFFVGSLLAEYASCWAIAVSCKP